LRLVPYETLFALQVYPPATYIFCDLDRLSLRDRERLTLVCMRLQAAGNGFRHLNDPRRVLLRYDLHNALYSAGINHYRSYRVAGMNRPTQYPVFLRGENDHNGAVSGLITDAGSLDVQLEITLAKSERNRASEPTLIVEFCAEPDQNGNYVKYGAFIVGDYIIPIHRIASPHWCTKYGSVTDEVAKANLEYVQSNPHALELKEIFGIAGVDYGRVDYGFVNGNVQVYEINLNPSLPKGFHPVLRESGLLFRDRFIQALRNIEENGSGESTHSGMHKVLLTQAQRKIDREDCRKQHWKNLKRHYREQKWKLMNFIKIKVLGHEKTSRLREIRDGIKLAVKLPKKDI
jgi:hypothetical protein